MRRAHLRPTVAAAAVAAWVCGALLFPPVTLAAPPPATSFGVNTDSPSSFADVHVGYGVWGRSFKFRSVTSGNLQGHSDFPFSTLGVGTTFYPGRAFGVSSWLAHVGFRFGYQQALDFDTTVDDGTQRLKLTTSHSALQAELLVRFGRDPLTFTTFLGSGRWNLRFTRPPEVRLQKELPDVDYRFVRFGGGASYAFEYARAYAELAGLFPTELGRVGREYLPENSAWGFDALIGGRYPLPWLEFDFAHVEAGLEFSFARFAHSYTSRSSDAYRAFGATDRLTSLRVLVAAVF